MATQVQIRGAASGTQNARTLVSRELDYDTTNDRLSPHDGSTAGGIPHVNYLDQQRNTFNYVSVTGTNALSGSLSKSPSAYQAGQAFFIKTANTNTGSVTLNLNSLGAKTLKKVFNGALTNLSAGDIISGQMLHVLYDGTYFQVLSGSGSEFGEQSFTPNITVSNGLFTINSTTINNAYYVDYGDSLTVSIDLDVNITNSGGTGDTTLYINNIPFSPKSSLAGSWIDNANASGNVGGDFVFRESETRVRILNTALVGGTTATFIYQMNFTYIKA